MNLEAPKFGLFQTLVKSLPTLVALIVMGAGWMAMHHINSVGSRTIEEASSDEETTPSNILELPDGKIRAGNFESAAACSHVVQHSHTVPGRFRYDATKHVSVRAPIDGILAELCVLPGEAVSVGQLLAIVRSPEIGQARSVVLKRLNFLEIANQKLHRQESVLDNLQTLSEMLDSGTPTEEIESTFKEKTLGGYRQEILSADAKRRLAEDLIQKIKPLVSSGSVPGRTLRERENERQLAETSIRAARDQAEFSAKQAVLTAQADASEGKRQLDLAWQTLDGLLGYPVDRSETRLTEDALSRLEVRAPFSGTVESCSFASNERVSRGDDLMIVANTDTLYVEASIRENDWPAVLLAQGTAIGVRAPAINDREFSAKVHYIGREVDAETNSVPLVATIQNVDGLFRPGMFVRVTIPIGDSRKTLAVKPESVLQHENQPFVFVDLSKGRFKRVDVSTGQVSDDWIEITSGLSPGQLVVTEGAFLLKSELLLQGEGE